MVAAEWSVLARGPEGAQGAEVGQAPIKSAVVQAASFMSTHTGEHLSLGDVADQVGYSPYHLARAFESEVGMPPGRFLAAQRFQRAKRLLLEGGTNATEVCVEVGFRSPGTFTTRFTSAVGVSPKGFKRLPELVAGLAPEPGTVRGPATPGGIVAGRVTLAPAATGALGRSVEIYVGLFERRAASGLPVCGALLSGPGDFCLQGVPDGTLWLMASAIPGRSDVVGQLVPQRTVAGAERSPIRMIQGAQFRRRDLSLDLRPQWAPPVLVALPILGPRAPHLRS